MGWLPAVALLSYDALVLLHKVRRIGEPADIAAMFRRNEEMRERTTRQDSRLCLPSIRTEAGRRRFNYRVAGQYNALPSEYQDMTVSMFKSAMKRHMQR